MIDTASCESCYHKDHKGCTNPGEVCDNYVSTEDVKEYEKYLMDNRDKFIPIDNRTYNHRNLKKSIRRKMAKKSRRINRR